MIRINVGVSNVPTFNVAELSSFLKRGKMIRINVADLSPFLKREKMIRINVADLS